jgi:hypothetical protein
MQKVAWVAQVPFFRYFRIFFLFLLRCSNGAGHCWGSKETSDYPGLASMMHWMQTTRLMFNKDFKLWKMTFVKKKMVIDDLALIG